MIRSSLALTLVVIGLSACLGANDPASADNDDKNGGASVSVGASCPGRGVAPSVVCRDGSVCAGARPTCCEPREGASWCIAEGGSCSTPDNPTGSYVDESRCDDAADCAEGQVCCNGTYSKGTSNSVVSCKEASQCVTTQRCLQTCECPSGQECRDRACR